MAEKHIQAYKDYVKGMKYKDLAEKYEVSVNTIKSWKQRHGWERKKGAPIEKSVHTKKGGQPGNKNAVGNNGGAPQRNQNAVTHGFFSKFLPEETLEIMEEIQERSPADMIWDQIQIQYAAIIRAPGATGEKIRLISSRSVSMVMDTRTSHLLFRSTNKSRSLSTSGLRV